MKDIMFRSTAKKRVLGLILALLLAISVGTFKAIPVYAMNIQITVSDGSASFNLDVEPSDTIGAVKEKIEERQSIPYEQQILKFGDGVLEDDNTLADYNIQRDSTIELIVAPSKTFYSEPITISWKSGYTPTDGDTVATVQSNLVYSDNGDSGRLKYNCSVARMYNNEYALLQDEDVLTEGETYYLSISAQLKDNTQYKMDAVVEVDSSSDYSFYKGSVSILSQDIRFCCIGDIENDDFDFCSHENDDCVVLYDIMSEESYLPYFTVAAKEVIDPGIKKVTETKKATATTPDSAITSIDVAKDITLNATMATALSEGKNINVFLEVSDVAVVEADKKLIKQSKELNGYTIGQYIDVNLFAMIENDEASKTSITKTNNKIEVSIKLPKDLINDRTDVDREYAVARLHDGKVDVLKATFDPKTGELKYKSDLYSTYAIIYKDSVDEKSETTAETTEEVPAAITEATPASTNTASPKTGDTTPIVLLFAIMMISSTAFVIFTKKEEK